MGILEIITLRELKFGWEDLAAASRKSGRRAAEADISAAARRAYDEGRALLDLRAVYEIYGKEEIAEGCQSLSLRCGDRRENLFIGPRIGYLFPAHEVVIALCTAGDALVQDMKSSAEREDYLMMYFLDSFGVRALAEMSAHLRAEVEGIAAAKGWGVGPSMQPGSVEGWSVRGQADLYRLGHGEALGLTLNDASFLLPHISNSALIGIGPHYKETKVGSMCHECPRHDSCLWRRENMANGEF